MDFSPGLWYDGPKNTKGGKPLICIEKLTFGNFRVDFLDTFLRHQVVTECRRKTNGQWALQPIAFVAAWRHRRSFPPLLRRNPSMFKWSICSEPAKRIEFWRKIDYTVSN